MAKDAKRDSVERHPLVDINVVADRLGVQVRHIRRLVHERRIPYVKWGHLVRFDPAEIDAWLEAARVASDSRRGREARGDGAVRRMGDPSPVARPRSSTTAC